MTSLHDGAVNFEVIDNNRLSYSDYLRNVQRLQIHFTIRDNFSKLFIQAIIYYRGSQLNM